MNPGKRRILALTGFLLALGIVASGCESTTGPKYPDPVEKKDPNPKDDEETVRPRRAAIDGLVVTIA